MKCLINPIRNQASELHQKLYSQLGSNQEQADKYYSMVNSDSFKREFGDWTSNENIKELYDRIDIETGEPILFRTQDNKLYFELKNKNRLYINRKLLNYNYKQKKALVSTGIVYLLGEQVTGNIDIQSIDFSKLYSQSTSNENGEEVFNEAYILLNGDAAALRELELNIRDYIGLESYKADDANDFNNELNKEISRALDLRTSNEKNSKDNATANIKFLLSFIPEFDNEGNPKLVNFTTEEGNEESILTYYDYNELWSTIEETLTGILPEVDNGNVVDLFDKMLNTLENKFPNNNTIKYLVNGLLNNLPDYKKNQFVQAFLKNKTNFYSITIDNTDSDLKLKIFDSASVTSRAKKIRNEFINGIRYKSNILNNTTNTINKDKVENISKSLESKFNEDLDKGEDITMEDAVDNISSILEQLGINIHDGAIEQYISSFNSEQGLMVDVEKAYLRLKFLVKTLSTASNSDLYQNGQFKSDILTKESILTDLSNTETNFRKDLSENTVLGSNNKNYWVYSLPNYLNSKLIDYKNSLENTKGNQTFYGNSLLLQRLKNKETVDNFELVSFLNLRKDDGDGGVDNKSIGFIDQYIAMLNQSTLIKSKGYNHSIFNTLAAPGKGKANAFRSDIFTATETSIGKEGFEFSEQIKELYKGYFIDEYNRINEAFTTYKEYLAADDAGKEIMKSKLYQNYHYDKGGNLFKTIDKGRYKGRQIPVGNAFTFTLFDDLNFDIENDIPDFVHELFNLSDEGVLFEPIAAIDDIINHPVINELIDNKLNNLLENNINELENKGLINVSKNDQITNKHTQAPIITSINSNKLADTDILNGYYNEGNNEEQAIIKFIGDSVINQHVYNVEYAKVFTGDYAFYKNLDDYSKRISGTYIDGVMLNLRPGDSPDFTLAVLPTYKVDTNLYKNIDGNDAQGYITLDRWKFLMERLNKWNPSYDEAYDRMLEGTSTAEDHKLTAQPLKGVFFDSKNGIPTYLKYSQLVLIPKVVAGTNIQKLHDNMVKQGIDEAVAITGVKVGANTISDVLEDNGDFKNDMTFYKQSLNNKGWRLQQDLTPKGIRATLLGSQIRKNIIQNIETDVIYNGISGSNLVNTIDTIYKDMSNYYLEKLQEEIGLDLEGNISNREKFYNVLLDEAKRNSNKNVIEALQKEYELDNIVNNKQYQPLIASVINNATIKIKTHGGSFIQSSSHGWTIEDATKAGVKMLVDTDKLKAPEQYTDSNGKKRVRPGQVFISHSEIAKFIPEYQSMDSKELKRMLDDKIRYIVGYRIPNQDLASSDALEIVGILPGMGDTIIPYIDITSKTGSDFDIDKVYAMLPNLKPIYENRTNLLNQLNKKDTKDLINLLIDNGWENKQIAELTSNTKGDKNKKNILSELILDEGLYREAKVKKLEYLSKSNSDNKIKLLENELLENYIHILTSPEKFKDLTNSLDSEVLPNDIKNLHNLSKKVDGFDFFNPLNQLNKKFASSAGAAGTGIISNHLVDQTYTQMSKFTMTEDLGVGNLDEDGNTIFYNIYDTGNNTKISQTLSWFLTAFVDIEKDPYITEGNYNTVTTDLAAMLLRAGTPLNWVNRFIGQPILKEYADLELNKKSRFNPTNTNSATIIENRLIERLKVKHPYLTNKEKVNEYLEKLENQSTLSNIRKDKLFTVKNLEKELANNDIDNQIVIFKVFQKQLALSKKFAATVTNSKADVNGAGVTIMENLTKQSNLQSSKSDLNGANELLFPKINDKFLTYLGTAQNNSVELVDKIFGKEFFSGKNKSLLIDFINKYKFDENAKSKLATIDTFLTTYTLSNNSFFNISEEESNRLLGGELQNKVLEAQALYPENVFLSSLVPATEKGYFFVDMENISNKPTNYQNDIIDGWDELFETDQELAEDLVKYSFLTTGFKYGIKSFYEFIPVEKYRALVQGSFTEQVNKELFEDFLIRHNPDLATTLKFREGTILLDSSKYGNKIVYKTIENNKFIDNFYKTLDDYGRVVNLYKIIGSDNNGYYFVQVAKAGAKVGGRNIIEPTINRKSSIATNNPTFTKNQLDNINQLTEDLDMLPTDIRNITEYNEDMYNLVTFTNDKIDSKVQEEIEPKCD